MKKNIIKILVFMMIIMSFVACKKENIKDVISYEEFLNSAKTYVEGSKDGNREYVKDFLDDYKKYDKEDNYLKIYELLDNYYNKKVDRAFVLKELRKKQLEFLKDKIKEGIEEIKNG
ncbi:hypothetical protein WG909_04905 [Peptostreptococcaceae bacterium AGR-M142]